MKFSCWNINGLECNSNGAKSNKLDDQEVINCLSNSDFVGLVETHADTITDISLPGYYTFRIDRPKNRKAYKSSGALQF